MKSVFIVFLLTFWVTSYSQYVYSSKAPAATPKDTIVRLGGKVILADVLKVTDMMVTFRDAADGKTKTIERKQLEKIIYDDGKLDVFSKPVFSMVDDTQWEAVLITDNGKDVDGLYERGKIVSISPPSSRSPSAAKRAATIKLQKKAVNMKGIIVLVTHRETRGGYGEMPGYYMEGLVYGTQPLGADEERIDETKTANK